MVKLTTFLTLIIFSINSYSSESNASKIVDSLFMVELSVNGALTRLSADLGDMPEKEIGLNCFTTEVTPKLKSYFTDTLVNSLDSDTLKQGAYLSGQTGVRNSKEFILASDLAKEAKSKGIRADVYMFYMASKEADTPLAQKELLDTSNWLKANGPVYSKQWVGTIKQYFSIVQDSIGACFVME